MLLRVTLVNSGFLTGTSGRRGKDKKLLPGLEDKQSLGTAKKNFKLRDWVFSTTALLG